MRLRITFAKTDHMRFTSHLDLHQAWERLIRRAGLPLAYSQGFNPHPKINLASALPLGFTGDNEVIDLWLEHEQPLDQVRAALDKASPPGIFIRAIEQVDGRRPALQIELVASEYQITFLEPLTELATRCQALLDCASLPRRRREKDYDLRPLLLELAPLPVDEQGRPRLHAILAASPGATGRPEEVVAELGARPEDTRVHRTRLVFS